MTRRVYVVASLILVAERKRRAREKFFLAVEGDNVEEIERYVAYPLARDLDVESMRFATRVVRERVEREIFTTHH